MVTHLPGVSTACSKAVRGLLDGKPRRCAAGRTGIRRVGTASRPAVEYGRQFANRLVTQGLDLLGRCVMKRSLDECLDRLKRIRPVDLGQIRFLAPEARKRRQPHSILGSVELVPVAEHSARFDHQHDRPAAALACFRCCLGVRRQMDVMPLALGQLKAHDTLRCCGSTRRGRKLIDCKRRRWAILDCGDRLPGFESAALSRFIAAARRAAGDCVPDLPAPAVGRQTTKPTRGLLP